MKTTFMFALLMAFAIELAILFSGGDYSKTSLFYLLQNPTSWESSILWLVILGIAAGFAASAIVAGNTFSWAIYAPYAAATAVFLSFFASIAHFYGFMCGELMSSMGIAADVTCYNSGLPWWITSVIISPLAIFYVIAALEWIRSN